VRDFLLDLRQRHRQFADAGMDLSRIGGGH
jgi:hypothetical protein